MKSPRRVASRRAIVTHLPEVTRVILIHHNSVMVLTTSHTATRRVLAVLADAAVTGGNVTALLAVLVQLRIRGKTNRTNIAASVDRSSRRKHSFPSILHHRSGRCTPRRVAAIPPIPGCDPRVCGKPQNHAWCAIRRPSRVHRPSRGHHHDVIRDRSIIAFDSFAFGARAVVADVLSSACLRVVKRRSGRCGKRGRRGRRRTPSVRSMQNSLTVTLILILMLLYEECMHLCRVVKFLLSLIPVRCVLYEPVNRVCVSAGELGFRDRRRRRRRRRCFDERRRRRRRKPFERCAPSDGDPVPVRRRRRRRRAV